MSNLKDRLVPRDLEMIHDRIIMLAIEQCLREFYGIGVHDWFPAHSREEAKQYVADKLTKGLDQ